MMMSIVILFASLKKTVKMTEFNKKYNKLFTNEQLLNINELKYDGWILLKMILLNANICATCFYSVLTVFFICYE